MISREEIEKMGTQLGVHPSDVQRDYVNGWLVSQLYSNSALARQLVLKGGNGLRKGYFEHSRYSRDLDFTTTTGISHDELGQQLTQICNGISDKSGVLFDNERLRVEAKKRADKEKTISEARIYFEDFYGQESEIVLSVRMDVTQFDRLYLPVQERFLIHPYSDADACRATIRCVKLEEILASKMRCLLQRRHIADLYDLAYSTLIKHDLALDRGQLISTFFKITIFGSSPGVAKGLLVELPLEAFGRMWDKFINTPLLGRFSFEDAKNSFLSFLDLLIPAQAIHSYSDTFFPSRLRNPIMEAAESCTLLKLNYKGYERLVEPYELVFKIRKDGIGSEYFYAYDTIGGSSPPGIKTFLPGQVESIENTDTKFEPREVIELKKAGGAETVSRFEKTRGSSANIYGFSKPRATRSKASSGLFRQEYSIQCPYCQRAFKRTTRDTTLRPHKDRYGNPCYGKRGMLSWG